MERFTSLEHVRLSCTEAYGYIALLGPSKAMVSGIVASIDAKHGSFNVEKFVL